MPALKLVWFVVRTRLSRPLIYITLIMVGYSVLGALALYTGHVELSPSLVKQERTLAVIYMAILVFLTSMQGGAAVLRSDRDYLFTLPLSRNEIALSLYVGQLMLSGVWSIVWLGWYLPFVEVPPVYAAPFMAFFVLLLTSLSATVAELEAKARGLVSAAIAVWVLLALAGIPVSPGAAFYGEYLAGTLTTAALSIGLTYYALARRLSKAPLLYSFPSQPKGSNEAPFTIAFNDVRGLKAVLRMRLSTITVTGRIGGLSAGGSRFLYRRYPLRRFLSYLWLGALLGVLAGVIAIRELGLPPLSSLNAVRGGPAQAALMALLIPTFVVLVMIDSTSIGQVGFERPWLAFTSVRASDYLRLAALSQGLIAFLVAAPFGAAYGVLALAGLRVAVNFIPQLLVAGPAFAVIYYALSVYLPAMPQIRAEGFMPGQARAIGLLLTFLIIVQFVILSASTGSLAVSVYSSAALALVAAALLTVRRPWDSAAERLVLAGYS